MWRKAFHALIVLLLVAAVATAVKVVFNLQADKFGPPRPCWSRDEAKSKGVWVCDVEVTPTTFTSEGKTYRLGEAWIEEAFDEDYDLIWFPRRTKLGWHFCLRVPRYEEGVVGVGLRVPGPQRRGSSATYAGSEEFEHVFLITEGNYPKVECQVVIEYWQPRKMVDIGKVALTARPDQK